MNRNDETERVLRRLERLDVHGIKDTDGSICLSLKSKETKGNIRLSAGEMDRLLDEACEIGIRSLPDGMFGKLVVSLYNSRYVYSRK